MTARGQLPPDLLFCKADWFAVAESQKTGMAKAIQTLDGDRLLNTPVEDLCDYFVGKYRVDVPVLDEAKIEADQREEQIDVSRDPMRFGRDDGRPVYVPGTAVEVIVPFDGDREVFQIRPSSFTNNHPRAAVGSGQLTITVRGPNLNGDQVGNSIRATLSEIGNWLGWLRRDADGLNAQLPQLARNQIEGRRRKLLADRRLVASLGFPLKQRADAPSTYPAPEVRRRIRVAPPPASAAPFKPEPALSMEDYEHILSVMRNMALVMERSPSAFTDMGEEALRSHLLVQLNGHYEGQATAETFNYEGKTDILIRSGGRNVFIAECKFWSGPKKLAETIDQLLGYMSWRDTKAAIVVFNRQKSFSHVLGEIPPAVEGHAKFKRKLGQTAESSFRYVFAHRDDPSREIICD